MTAQCIMTTPGKSPEIALRVNEVAQCDEGRLWWKGVNRPLQPSRPWKMAAVSRRTLWESECPHSTLAQRLMI